MRRGLGRSHRQCLHDFFHWRGHRRHAARHRRRRNQKTVAAIGKFKPRTAAGGEHAGRRAKAAQPLQPHRTVGRQPVGELHDLAPVRIRRSESSFSESRTIADAEQVGADGIAPQNPRAVARPQPCGQGARRMRREPRIAEALQLEFRIVHRVNRIAFARG